MISITHGRKALLLSVILAAQFASAEISTITTVSPEERGADTTVSGLAEVEALREMLIERTLGNNPLYNRVISPARSLDKNQSDSERVLQANNLMLNNIQTVLSAFNNAAEADKAAAVQAALNQLDPEIIKNKGVNIQFIKGEPSAAISRNFVMIQKNQSNASLSAESLLNTLSSYRRSARPSDHAYEYSMVDNLQQSTIKYTRGDDNTWKPPQAPAPIAIDSEMAIKKCRQILGWRCATALYNAGEVLDGDQNTKYFYTGSYNIKDNPDHSDFAKDGRSKNQVAGSTGLVVIKESAEWILMYGMDSQFSNGNISFASQIQDAAEKDLKRFKERIMLDMAISENSIR